jgi:hypothetical protein
VKLGTVSIPPRRERKLLECRHARTNMRKKSIRYIVGVTFTLVLGLGSWGSSAISADAVNHGLYGDLLKKYVSGGMVDYQGLKKEEARLDQYLKVLEKTDSKALTRDEQFAFYVNAYNAWTIKMILNWPASG